MSVATYAIFVAFGSVLMAVMRRRPDNTGVRFLLAGSSLKTPLLPPVAAVIAILPLANHEMVFGSYCQDPSTFSGVPPATGTTYTRSLFVRPGAAMNAMRLLSGDHVRLDSFPKKLATLRGVPPVAGIT